MKPCYFTSLPVQSLNSYHISNKGRWTSKRPTLKLALEVRQIHTTLQAFACHLIFYVYHVIVQTKNKRLHGPGFILIKDSAVKGQENGKLCHITSVEQYWQTIVKRWIVWFKGSKHTWLTELKNTHELTGACTKKEQMSKAALRVTRTIPPCDTLGLLGNF